MVVGNRRRKRQNDSLMISRKVCSYMSEIIVDIVYEILIYLFEKFKWSDHKTWPSLQVLANFQLRILWTFVTAFIYFSEFYFSNSIEFFIRNYTKNLKFEKLNIVLVENLFIIQIIYLLYYTKKRIFLSKSIFKVSLKSRKPSALKALLSLGFTSLGNFDSQYTLTF